MAPTRELAMQSFQVVVDVGGPKGVCVYGGVPKPQQKNDLRQGADIVVATPGRLMDLLEEGALSLTQIIYAVLDEADRMLDEGFAPAIKRILAACPPCQSSGGGSSGVLQRQTVMFSATWPEEIRMLADTYLCKNTIRVICGSEELSANHRVTQIVEVLGEVPYSVKDKKLLGLLEKYHKSRTNRCLIFVLYKKEAVALQQTLQNKGYKVRLIYQS
jgi:ATP-dependent RNA helicase DBP3